MPELKQQLTELIEAFAIARQTGNQRLVESSARSLVEFLESVEITLPEDDGSEE